MGAIDPHEGYQVATAECVMCLDCLADCPQDEMGLVVGLPRPATVWKRQAWTSLSRRQALGAMALGTAGVLLAEIDVHAK